MLQTGKVLVIGTGVSGIAAANLLIHKNCFPIILEENEKITRKEIMEKLPPCAENKVELYFGELPERVKKSIRLVVPSPGISLEKPLIRELIGKKIPLWGEIELGFRFSKGKIIAITGTNGKTTTTTLVGEILKAYEEQVFVVGNIGNPYTLEAMKTTSNSVTVAEISSFQLETTQTFHPNISAILNISEDHLDRHHRMENYVAMKEKIAKLQDKADVCVLNYDNPYTLDFGRRCSARVIWFSSSQELREGYYLKDGWIYQAEEKEIPFLNIHNDMKLKGICNVENVMAAIAITKEMGIPKETILEVIRRFHGVAHRIEYVATKKGVEYYNDSKATNPDSAIRGIQAMEKPTLLIGGGYDKESNYEKWIQSFEGKVKLLVLLGETKEKIAACAKQHGFSKIEMADTLEEAFDICVQRAEAGDAVLLSPACASWGMFPNYEVRGNTFKEYVSNLKE